MKSLALSLAAVALCAVWSGAASTHVARAAVSPKTSVEQDFRDPPVTVRPFVWWHWMGPNFSEAGITRDLEAMKEAGIGGATIFNITSAVQESHAPTLNNPWPDQVYRGEAYWRALRHAVSKGRRLGIEIGLHNTVGYSTTGGPWIDEPRSMQRVVWSATDVEGGGSVEVTLPAPTLVADEGWGKTGRPVTVFKDIAVLAFPATGDIPAGEVRDLTSSVGADFKLKWDAPPGKWRVLRLGHASTGRPPHPVPDDLIGKTLEADKMSLEQTTFHWRTVLDPIRERLGPDLRVQHYLIDSYEAGGQNWSPGFRADFIRLKGYDPLPWLVTLTPAGGDDPKARRIVGSKAQTDRFEWDLRDAISTLFYDNGFKPGADMIRAAGATLQWEPYGGPFDTIDGTALSDLPMGEFWTGSRRGINSPVIVPAARAAGRTVVGAEAFTGSPDNSKWTETPAFLKADADASFAAGVNRLILHHWVHQPFDDRHQPGMGMGWWGTHFSRHQTWFEPGKEFFRYLGRAQALLQRGEAPADFLSVGALAPGDTPATGDVISWRAFRTDVAVRDGRIVLPSGRSYPFLHVPARTITPQDLGRVRTLLEQGAIVVMPKPIRAPGLTDYPGCDDLVRKGADELFGDGTQPVRSAGAGTLYTAGDPAVALSALGIEPAIRMVATDAEAADLRTTYRRDGDTHVFFVANVSRHARTLTGSFRVAGMMPEFWSAEDGSIRPVPAFRTSATRTELDLTLGAEKSIFVVFRRGAVPAVHATQITSDVPRAEVNATAGSLRLATSRPASIEVSFSDGSRRSVRTAGPTSRPVEGPWAVELRSPVQSPVSLKLPALASLSADPRPEVRYFAGVATYTTTFEMPEVAGGATVSLDLGTVHDLATVTLNGQRLGVAWHGPRVFDVTPHLRPGTNTLEVAVANTWHNRLVGDEQEPPDFEYGTDRGGRGRALKAYPEWFLRDLPRPSQARKTFVTWFYHRKDTPLRPAGLVGPVKLMIQEPVVLPTPR